MTDLHDMVRELTDKHVNRERYDTQRGRMRVWQDHVTTNPALLDQLAESVEQSGSSEDGMRAGFGSKPTARLDAIDTLMRIDGAAGDLVVKLGGSRKGDTKALVTRVGALAAAQDDATVKAVTRDVTRWWTWARIVTGWDTPAWSPDNTCPLCGTRGSIRVRLAANIGMCTEDTCRETWDQTTIGLLADHIRAESEEEGRVRLPLTNRVPCQCRTCNQLPEDALVLCPGCGSSRCPKAADHDWPCAGTTEQAG
jgi:hypothetical protein